jgi:hypothetical protein
MHYCLSSDSDNPFIFMASVVDPDKLDPNPHQFADDKL